MKQPKEAGAQDESQRSVPFIHPQSIALCRRAAPRPSSPCGRWGRLMIPDPTRSPVGVPLRCVQVACGSKRMLALMEGGFGMSWGRGVGYFGHGDNLSL